jgi:DNA-directed RNA polymerase specialized sigma24 family protein
VPAEIAGQRPLLERAAAGDREAFAQLYDAQVEGVYRYLLAWTGNRQQAADLTGQVFHTALGWLPTATRRDGELAAWLVAMAHDTVAQPQGPGTPAGSARAAGSDEPVGAVGPAGAREPAGGVVAAVGRLGDPEREVVVLRLLLGHSLAHTAHLSGHSPRAVLGLQLAACLTISDLTGGAPADPAARTAASAEEFERRLGPWEIDPTGSDPPLAGALAAAATLRQAIPSYVVAPTPDLVADLRHDLLTAVPADPPGPPAPLAHPAAPADVAEPRGGGVRSSTGSLVGSLLRRPWVATGVATAGIVLVLGLQAFGQPGPSPSPTSTTAAVAAGGTSLGTPLTTVLGPSTTTSSTQPAEIPPTSAARAATPATPPTTRPATTAPQTTSALRPTTTRAPTTTVAPTTTAPPTTTTAAPAPT